MQQHDKQIYSKMLKVTIFLKYEWSYNKSNLYLHEYEMKSDET